MKNNIAFYQHYANADQHPKFKMLRSEYGWEGEGRFWALNNRIAQADNCCLDVDKKYNKAAIASDLNLRVKEFDIFIKFLLNDCELIIECDPGIITTDIIQENFDRVSIDRASARERSKKRWGNIRKSSQKSTRSSTEQSKSSAEQLSKVKESKINKSKRKKSFTPPTKEETQQYFFDNGYTKQSGLKAWEYYEAGNWFDANGNKVKSWKQKMRGVWFKDKNKITINNVITETQKDIEKEIKEALL